MALRFPSWLPPDRESCRSCSGQSVEKKKKWTEEDRTAERRINHNNEKRVGGMQGEEAMRAGVEAYWGGGRWKERWYGQGRGNMNRRKERRWLMGDIWRGDKGRRWADRQKEDNALRCEGRRKVFEQAEAMKGTWIYGGGVEQANEWMTWRWIGRTWHIRHKLEPLSIDLPGIDLPISPGFTGVTGFHHI